MSCPDALRRAPAVSVSGPDVGAASERECWQRAPRVRDPTPRAPGPDKEHRGLTQRAPGPDPQRAPGRDTESLEPRQKDHRAPTQKAPGPDTDTATASSGCAPPAAIFGPASQLRSGPRTPSSRSVCHPSSRARSLFPGENPKPYCLGKKDSHSGATPRSIEYTPAEKGTSKLPRLSQRHRVYKPNM